jgi:2-methylcitrate dehydratase PrpD
METNAQRLAAFAAAASHADFPALARTRAVDAITDCVGCMLAGVSEPLAAKVVRASAAGSGSGASALVVGAGTAASPGDAALCNGTLAHALDYDDTNHPAYAHPSAVLVPTILALAPVGDFDGRDAVTAYILGLEVFGKLGRALNTAHYRRGWHATATFGSLASAVAAGRLLRLPADRMTMAIGIAASAAGGLRANFGSMVKPLHAGYAARNGVLAALLAREGFEASEFALDHDYGYFALFSGDGHFDPAPLQRWGEPLEILTPYGLALKPYPSCGATHTGIEAALELRGELGSLPPRSVYAGVSELAFSPLIHVMPQRPLEGKFSLHYCIAAALVDGAVNLASFTPQKVADPTIRSLIERTTMRADERVGDGAEFPTLVQVETGDGRRLERFVPLAQGKPERWFTPARIREKYDDCTRGFEPDAIDRAYEALRALDGDLPVEGTPRSLLDTLRQVRPRQPDVS